MSELKPCPFCGDEAVPIEDTVECESCDFGTYNSLWNQRVSAVPISELEEAIKPYDWEYAEPEAVGLHDTIKELIDKYRQKL